MTGFIGFAPVYLNGLLAIFSCLLFRVWCSSAPSTSGFSATLVRGFSGQPAGQPRSGDFDRGASS